MTVARAIVRSAILVRVEMRPPKRGEAGFHVDASDTPAEALEYIIDERDEDPSCGALGFGWTAEMDYPPTIDPMDGTRAVTVTATETVEIGPIEVDP